MKRIFWSTILITLLLPLGQHLDAEGSRHTLVANVLQVHIDEANYAYRMGLYDEAWRILLAAEDFRDGYQASFLNLEAKLLFKKGYYTQAQALFEKLLHYDDLDAQGEAYLYEVYLRGHQYEAIKELFHKGLLQNSEAHFYYQLALFHTNDPTLRAFSQEAIQRFNRDIRFMLPLFLAESQPSTQIDRILLLSSMVKKDRSYFKDISVVSQEIILALLLRVDQEWQDLFLVALEPWLANHINYQLVLRDHIQNSAVDHSSEQWPSSWLKWQLPSTFTDPNWSLLVGNYLLKDYITSLNDEALIKSALPWGADADGDGFADLIGNVNAQGNGFITVMSPGDLTTSATMYYQRFVMQNLIEDRGETKVSIHFSLFPQVERVEVSEYESPSISLMKESKESNLIYYLRYDVLSIFNNLSGIKLGSSEIPSSLAGYQGDIINLDELVKQSVRIDEMRDNWLFRRLRVVDGEIIQVWEDSQNKGYFDRFLELKNGSILYGRRTFSLYDDYLLLEIYDNNQIKGLAFSDDGTNFDFYQEENTQYLLQVWDFNINNYINVYRKKRLSQGQPREQRVWLSTPIPVSALMQRNFDEAKRWLREVY